MKLNFRKMGVGEPLMILHGVFGSADNWQTVAKELAKHFTCYLIDQRNHGLSPHDDKLNYDVMANDLKDLIDAEQLKSPFILGHSMGGKTAMTFATKYPNMVSKLIIVDITPRAYPPHHGQIFKGFRSIDLAVITSRREADEMLSKEVTNIGVRQFMLKNLHRGQEKFEWKINLGAIEANATEIGKPLAKHASFEGQTLFIGGGNSDYILTSDHDIIKTHFPDSKIKMIEGAGHWVHAEKPKELIVSVLNFLL